MKHNAKWVDAAPPGLYIRKIFPGGRFLPKITTFDGLKAFQTRRVCNLFLLLSRHVSRMMLAGVSLASRTLLSPCLGCCFGPSP